MVVVTDEALAAAGMKRRRFKTLTRRARNGTLYKPTITAEELKAYTKLIGIENPSVHRKLELCEQIYKSVKEEGDEKKDEGLNIQKTIQDMAKVYDMFKQSKKIEQAFSQEVNAKKQRLTKTSTEMSASFEVGTPSPEFIQEKLKEIQTLYEEIAQKDSQLQKQLDANDKFKGIDDIIKCMTCTICEELYDDERFAYVTSCGHVFCMSCCQKMKGQCAICRKQNVTDYLRKLFL